MSSNMDQFALEKLKKDNSLPSSSWYPVLSTEEPQISASSYSFASSPAPGKVSLRSHRANADTPRAFSILAAVPIWVNECVPPRNRGGFITLMGIMLLLGYNAAIWGAYGIFLSHLEANNQWRVMLALQCVPVVILLLCMPWMPESPRWLVMKGRLEDAREVLLKLHERAEAEVEMRQIQDQIEIDKTLPGDWYTMLWRKPSYRKRSLLSFGTTASIQFSGILVINSKPS